MPTEKKTAETPVKKAAGTSAAAKKPAKAGTAAAGKKTAVTPAAEKKAAPVKKAAAKPAAKKPAADKPDSGTPVPEASVTAGKQKRKVLFVTAEALPFAATGGLAEVAGSLPKAINEASGNGYDVRVVMPYYTYAISDEQKKYMSFVGNINVPLAWRNQYCGVYTAVRDGVRYYFLDNEYYFKRNGLYGHYDDGERFAFFSKAVLDILTLIDFFPDVIHSNDWQAALVPVFYKLFYMYRHPYENIKNIFTIHNIEYQGKFPKNCTEDLFGIPMDEYHSISDGESINLMKAAIDYCDKVSTVSPRYAEEIKSDYFAHGLAGVLVKNSSKLQGILNGIDTVSYDSKADRALFENFDADTLWKKAKNKTELQKMLNLTVGDKIPMIAVISRLAPHKGIDLIKAACHDLLRQDVQLVVLGTGNAEFEAFFKHLAAQYPQKVSAIIAFNKDLSRKLYGASDMFLMPSKSEPCGLSQMIASRYASVPIVRETGGLCDSIKDCNDGMSGNGYTFATYNAGDMLNCINRALGLYNYYPDIWRELMKRIITVDFSWNVSAKEYITMYESLLSHSQTERF